MSLLGHGFQVVAVPWEETIYHTGIIELWVENKLHLNQGKESYTNINRSE